MLIMLTGAGCLKLDYPGLKVIPLFWFGYNYTSVYFKTLENKTSIERDKNSGKLSSCL